MAFRFGCRKYITDQPDSLAELREAHSLVVGVQFSGENQITIITESMDKLAKQSTSDLEDIVFNTERGFGAFEAADSDGRL